MYEVGKQTKRHLVKTRSDWLKSWEACIILIKIINILYIPFLTIYNLLLTSLCCECLKCEVSPSALYHAGCSLEPWFPSSGLWLCPPGTTFFISLQQNEESKKMWVPLHKARLIKWKWFFPVYFEIFLTALLVHKIIWSMRSKNIWPLGRKNCFYSFAFVLFYKEKN